MSGLGDYLPGSAANDGGFGNPNERGRSELPGIFGGSPIPGSFVVASRGETSGHDSHTAGVISHGCNKRDGPRYR
jgi:hypothetical protein